MPLDACCQKICELICQGNHPSPRSLAKLVEKSALARSTVMLHLKHLETNSLLAKEEILQQGRVGRPKTLYKPSPELLGLSTKTKSD